MTLPESFTGGRTYQIQYGRRFSFGAAGQQTSSLRIKRQTYEAASLEALVSGAGTANVNLTVCFPVLADTTCGATYTQSLAAPATHNLSAFVAALNTYLLGRTEPWGDPVDVPVRVQVDRQADVMLTNLALTTQGARTRYLRLAAREYSLVTLSPRFGTASDTGQVAFTVDIGANNTVEWSGVASPPAYPATITSPGSGATASAITAAINAYLTANPPAQPGGDVSIPIRILPSPGLATSLVDFTAVAQTKPDLSVVDADVGFGASLPLVAQGVVTRTEGDVVPITATIRNPSMAASGPVTVAYYATPPGGASTYVGSDFLANVPAGGSAPSSVNWKTVGFTGTCNTDPALPPVACQVPVRVVVDAFGRLSEGLETNNSATKTLTLATRPDLKPDAITLANPEPVVGEAVVVSVPLRNLGQTNAPSSVVALHDGTATTLGAQVGTNSQVVTGGGTATATFTWTPSTPGLHVLYATGDHTGLVGESNESNNQLTKQVYVGFAGARMTDSGAANDLAYTEGRSFGFKDQGTPDATGQCGTGASAHETFRRGPDGQVSYQFDHLLPGHFYHLDLTMYECDSAGRQQTVEVDGNVITAQPENLGDGRVHRLSLRLDPALYADRQIVVTVRSPGIDGAVVSEINLHDVDYRYADAGNASTDPQYPGPLPALDRDYGWVDPATTAQTDWGLLPHQSVRVNQAGPTVVYRFDGLLATKAYQVQLTFWQPDGAARVQNVQIDGANTGVTVNTGDYQQHRFTIDVPQAAYVADGRIDVGIVRTNGPTGAMVSEIALEEVTTATQGAVFAGTVVLQGRGVAPNALWQVPLTVNFYQPGTTSLVSTAIVTTDSAGGFTTSVAPGTYDVEVKHSQALSRKRAGITLATGTNPAQSFGTLPVGDASNNNIVNIEDFSILRSTFAKTSVDAGYDGRADFSADQLINIADFSFLRVNFGQGGPLTAAASAAVAPGIPVAETAILSLELPSVLPAVGETFPARVVANVGSQPVDGVEVHLSFDPRRLQVIDAGGNITPGAGFDQVLLNRVDAVEGWVDFAAGSLTGPFPTDTFTVGTLTFRVLGPPLRDAPAVRFVNTGTRQTQLVYAGTIRPLRLVEGATGPVPGTPLSLAPGPSATPTLIPSLTPTPRPQSTAQARAQGEPPWPGVGAGER